MFQWAQKTFDQISQTVAPPPTDGPGRFSYNVQRNDEDAAMGCIAEFNPVYTVVNEAKGWYPIHLACQYSQTRLIRLLLNQPGMNIEQPDGEGNTALHHACISSDPRALEVVQTLVNECGANALAKNGMGQVPYDLASSNNVRQFLLPIQLQKETQIALDNGGQGLPPGIDLGGLRISNPNMAPPPKSFGSAPTGRSQSNGGGMYPPTPIPTAPGPTTARTQTAPTPTSMPHNPVAINSNNSAPDEGYSLRGSSSAAIFSSKYMADGFHSSSSDVNLQQKYGHHAASRSVTAPPPSSGNSSLSAVGAPISGNAAAGGVAGGGVAGDGTNNPFSRGSALPKSRYVAYGPTETAPAPVPAAVQPAYNQYAPVAPAAAGNFSTFSPAPLQPAGPATPAQPTQSSNVTSPTTPFMPPPPYQTQNYESPSKRPDFVSPAAATYGGSPSMTPPAPGTATREQSAQDVFATTPQPAVPTSSTPTTSTSAGSAQRAFPSAPISGMSVGSAQELFSAPPQPTPSKAPVSGASELFAAPRPTESEPDPAAPGSSFNGEQKKGEETEQLAPGSETEQTAGVGDASTQDTPTSHSNPEPASSEEWVETTDPSTGQIYYYNTRTHETSWEDPKGGETSWEDPKGGGSATQTTTDIASHESDWVETPDPATGKMYYYNTVTHETSWEKPAGAGEEEDDKLASGWTEVVDPSSGHIYYYNEETQETSWEKPAAASEATDSPQAGDDWIETVDPSSGQIYYYNQVTQETSWEKPQSLQERKPDAVDSQAPAEANNVTSSDWIEAVDPTSGSTYYYNQVTQETSWEKPEEQGTGTSSGEETAPSAPSHDSPPSHTESSTIPSSQEKASFTPPPSIPGGETLATRKLSAEELFGEGPPTQDQQAADAQTETVDAAAVDVPTENAEPIATKEADTTPEVTSSAVLESADQDVVATDEQETKEENPAETTTKEPVVDDVDGTEVGEMSDIPLSPEPQYLKSAQQAEEEPPKTADDDLFAAIGMPPPPFKSKR